MLAMFSLPLLTLDNNLQHKNDILENFHTIVAEFKTCDIKEK